MSLMVRLATVTHWAALALWIAAIVAAGVAAIGVFGTLADVRLTVHEYAAFPNDANQHGMLAAGRIMERVFFLVDVLQFIAAPLLLASASLELVLRLPWSRGRAGVARLVCMATAVATLTYQAVVVSPTMNRELRSYWEHAAAGNVLAAQAHQESFNQLHPRAEMLMNARLALLLIVLVLSAAAGVSTHAPPANELQRPLLRNRS
jgi:hypothetical protein